MKNIRSWAILAAVVGTVGLTAYAAAESGAISTANATAENTSTTAQVTTGCVPYPETGKGTVLIRFVDSAGNDLEQTVAITDTVGASYSTTAHAKAELTVNGVGYYLDTTATAGTETGTIPEGGATVTYTYRKYSKVVYTYYRVPDYGDRSIIGTGTIVENLKVGETFDLDDYVVLEGNIGYYAQLTINGTKLGHATKTTYDFRVETITSEGSVIEKTFDAIISSD